MLAVPVTTTDQNEACNVLFSCIDFIKYIYKTSVKNTAMNVIRYVIIIYFNKANILIKSSLCKLVLSSLIIHALFPNRIPIP